MQELSQRATFAAVLVTLVRQRCAETGATRTSRTGLQLRVPVDALIDHGLLGTSGEDIGLTAHGRILLSCYRRQRGDTTAADDLREPATLHEVLAAVERDARFDPDGAIAEAQTLPGRLEELRGERRRRLPGIWIVLAAIVALIGVVLLALPAR
jgi:hypothetical protein